MSPDRRQKQPDTHDLDHPFDVIAKHMQAHFGADMLDGSGEKMRCSHP